MIAIQKGLGGWVHGTVRGVHAQRGHTALPLLYRSEILLLAVAYLDSTCGLRGVRSAQSSVCRRNESFGTSVGVCQA